MFLFRYLIAKSRNDAFLDDFVSEKKYRNRTYPPKFVVWDCTRRCNLNCKHCGASKERYASELTTEQIKNIILQLSKMKVPYFAVTGGEPLVRNDLFEILGYANSLGVRTGIATNGFLVNEKIAQKIHEANLSSVQISLDGPEKVHNVIRGNEMSFQKAINAIKLIHGKTRSKVLVATTVSPINLEYLTDIKNILLSLGVKKWRLAVVMPIGRAGDNSLLLGSVQLKEVLNWVVENSTKKLEIYIGENLPFLKEYETKIRKAPMLCPIGFTACTIGVTGNVRGCPEQPDREEYWEGNILKTAFKDIWENGFLRYRNREVFKEDLKCSSCPNKKNCSGGCWVMREANVHCIYTLLKKET